LRKCDRDREKEEQRYLKTRLEIEVCFGSRNGDRAGFVLAPAARFAAPAARETAERSKHLAADIVKNQHQGVLPSGSGVLHFFFALFLLSLKRDGLGFSFWIAATLDFLGPSNIKCFFIGLLLHAFQNLHPAPF